MENLQPESVSRETLIAQYFPGQTDAIQRYADFLVGAGIERGLIRWKISSRSQFHVKRWHTRL